MSQTFPTGAKRQSTTLIEQKEEAALTLVAKRVLQRFQDLFEQVTEFFQVDTQVHG
jgi:hypothetical protein